MLTKTIKVPVAPAKYSKPSRVPSLVAKLPECRTRPLFEVAESRGVSIFSITGFPRLNSIASEDGKEMHN